MKHSFCLYAGIRILFCVTALLAGAGEYSTLRADDWWQFRGPGARGISDHRGLPSTWSSTENVAWKADLPGRGWSSPIVVGDRVIVTAVVNRGESEEPKKGLYFGGDRPVPPEADHEWRVICLDLETGAERWNVQVHQGKPQTSIHLKNSFASETPVSDGQRIYAYFGNVGMFCLDLDGQLLWQRPFAPHPTRLGWGTAASPVLFGDRLYVVDDNEEHSTLTALDKRTGDVIWQVDRDEKSNWATPFVWQHAGGTEIITAGTGQVRSYDLDGKILWTLSGMSSITIGTPFEADGLLYISSGYVLDKQRPVYAIRPGARGDISLAEEATSNDSIVWANREIAPYNPSLLVVDGRLHVLYDRGMLACYRAATGETIYDRQRIPDGGAYTASPWAHGGKIFCLNEDGVTEVFAAGDEFKWLHKNELAEDDMGMATPAIAGDRLLIRTSARLYCIRQADPAR